ncbi:hypothetical protein ACLG6S_00410 [Thermodesulfobacteriota bacterium B35]
MDTMNKAGMFCFCCLLALLTGAGTAAALNYFHVSPNGTGTGSRLDPTNLQDALDRAGTSSTDNYIFLRQGTYRGNFHFQSTTDKILDISGGWKDDYQVQVADPTKTVLTGTGQDSVLKINDIDNNTFSGNILISHLTVRNGHGEIGGGIYAVTTPPGRITISDTIIENNSATSQGGGCALISVDPSFSSGDRVLLEKSIIRNNRATGYMDGNSHKYGEGGGCIIAVSSHTMINNSLVYGNSAGTAGTFGGIGGGLSLPALDGFLAIVNTTITDNRVYAQKDNTDSSAGGIALYTLDQAWGPAEVRIVNSIIYGNQALAGATVADLLNFLSNYPPGSSIGIRYSDIGELGTYGGVTPDLQNTLHVNPRFSRTAATRLYLLAGSRCIDSGENIPGMSPVDLAGNRRPQDGDGDGKATTNMGCYEKVVHYPWHMFIPAFVSGSRR